MHRFAVNVDFGGKQNDLPYLDGVRATAAIIVLLSHFSNSGFLDYAGFSLSGIGKSGVYLFFFLSAFLLTRLLILRDLRFWQPRPMAEYLARRTLRIYPLVIVYLLVSLVATALAVRYLGRPAGFPLTIDGGEFVGHLLLMQGKGVLWSIPVEFKYYFLLPFVAFAMAFGLRRSVTGTILAVAAFCALVEIWLALNESRTGGIALRYYIQIFILGSLLGGVDALFRERLKRIEGRLRPLATLLLLASVAVYVLLIPDVASRLRGAPVDAEAIQTQYLLFGVLWLCFFAGLMFGAPVFRRVFETRALRYVGLLSFSVYLWHEGVIRMFHWLDLGLSPTYAWVILFAVTLAISHLSFVLVERPCLKISPARVVMSLRRRLGGEEGKRRVAG
jgi:peptidoglycan/LPS O-acetylase OafA/YrhL